MDALILAAAYLWHHRGRSLVLVLVMAVVAAVPVASRVLLDRAEARLTLRAEATPLVLGRRGSALDLSMSALYFADIRPPEMTMAAAEAIWESGYGIPIPMHLAYGSGGHRIVGTSLDYFAFRGLAVAAGRPLAVLGEAVLGASVARAQGLAPGDSLVSTPENLFDLDGVYPLEMAVVGVLAPTGTPDDDAIFVDLRTAWVIAGIGHGHDDVVQPGADGAVQAAASLVQFRRITPENIDSFHFHGDPERYPIHAVIVDPDDVRGATILRGRYIGADNPLQMIVPAEVVQGLVDRIFRIRTVLDAVSLAIGLGAMAAVALAVFLAWRLRAREVETAIRIGASRLTIVGLLAAETTILLGLAALLSISLSMAAIGSADALVAWLLNLGP